MKKVWTYLVIAFIALLASVNYELFVFPNQFAPSGINGICTMIQYVTGVSVGYLSLFINIPLAIWCYFEVSKPMAIRSMVYVVTFSLGLLILEKVDLSAFAYVTENGTSKILGPMVAGVIQGFVYSILIKASAYTGGTDFVSAIVHKHHPNRPFFGMSFAINSAIAIVSYFVYGCQMEPVILCILYTFMSTTVGDRLMKSGREAICFEIITNSPQEVSRELIDRLHTHRDLHPSQGYVLRPGYQRASVRGEQDPGGAGQPDRPQVPPYLCHRPPRKRDSGQFQEPQLLRQGGCGGSGRGGQKNIVRQ